MIDDLVIRCCFVCGPSFRKCSEKGCHRKKLLIICYRSGSLKVLFLVLIILFSLFFVWTRLSNVVLAGMSP